jgi:hypothetical protein
MMTNRPLTLWSRRTNAAVGNHWVAERGVTEATAQEWLAVFRKDEPNVIFVACAHRPRG